jgi:hypothetical protein
MNDEIVTMEPTAAHDGDAAQTEDDAQSSPPSSPEEVAQELVSFLAQLSPFRIRSYRADQ